MWIAEANRKNLLDFISLRDPFKIFEIVSTKELTEIKDQEDFLVVWQKKPTNLAIPLPDIICVKDGKLREFLAWVSTYISPFQPFTAFCRVIEFSYLNEFIKKTKAPISGDLENVILGTIIGETITHLINNNIKFLTPAAIKSTLSFALSRGLYLGYGSEDYDFLLARFKDTRLIAKQQNRVLGFNIMKSVWDIIFSIVIQNKDFRPKTLFAEYSDYILEACISIKTNGYINRSIWQKLTHNKIDDKAENIDIKRPREDRVKLFEYLTSLVKKQTDIPSNVCSFLCGYLAFQIAPGQFDFTDLLRPFLSKYPDTIVWYFLCSGLYKDSDIRNFNRGFGWRILRDLMIPEDIYDRPQCDLSLDELKTLMNVDQPATDFITFSHTHLILEMAPMIYISAYWPPSHQTEQLELFESDYDEELKRRVLMKLGQNINKTRELFDDYKKLISGHKGRWKSKFRKSKY